MKKRLVCLVLSVALLLTQSTFVMATTKSEIQRQKAEAEQELEEAQSRINSLSEQQAAISAQINETNADLVDKMVQIEVAEQDIAATEGRIAETQGQIDVTTANLAIAEADKANQYSSMKTRIRYIYENGGDSAWFRIILQATDITNMLNRAEYAQSMHDYDRKMFAQYSAIVQQVTELKISLETQKAELETEKAFLEEQKAALQEQEAQLQASLAQLQATNNDYAAQISEAKAQARSISELIAAQQAELERIAEEERRAEEARRAAEEARRQQANNNSNGSGSSSNKGSGSQTVPTYNGNKSGESIVAYADQFVGNPYVWGGNSLTNGIDCSHFVYQVLKNCGVYSGGYVTSAGWRTKGSPVGSLSQAQAGDVICYSGHVAIYDGYGGIVEAKGSKWGITHDRSATYGKILAIRRFI